MNICIIKQLSGPVSQHGKLQAHTPAKDMVNRADGFIIATDMPDARKKARERGWNALAERLDTWRDDPKPGEASVEIAGDRHLILVE